MNAAKVVLHAILLSTKPAELGAFGIPVPTILMSQVPWKNPIEKGHQSKDLKPMTCEEELLEVEVDSPMEKAPYGYKITSAVEQQ